LEKNNNKHKNHNKQKIIQIVPTLGYGDAIANDVLAIKHILESMGHETAVYSTYINERQTEPNLFVCENLPVFDDDTIIILHISIESIFNSQILETTYKTIGIYHNITPPEFFEIYAFHLKEKCGNGLNQVMKLKDRFDLVLADSEFNKQDLIAMGYDEGRIKVLPIVIPYEDYRKPYNPEMYNRLKSGGVTNILFVGRVAPNKKQEDIIRIFSYYKKNINPNSRLCLVGNQGLEDYFGDLSAYAEVLEIGDTPFLGHISFREILACYAAADIFLCASEHEGFCVPLVEAMLFDLPIIAYESTAVPETLGGGGIIIDDKSPEFAANVMDRLLKDGGMLEELRKGREERLEFFSFEKIKEKFISLINNFLDDLKTNEKIALQNAAPLIEKIKLTKNPKPQVEKNVPNQIVFLSSRQEALLSTLVYVEKNMRFITECLVVCPDNMADSLRNSYKGKLNLTIITDGELLSGLNLPQKHTTRNFFLRCLLMLRPELDNEFIMSDDDYRPMVDIPISVFKENGKYIAYECADLKDWLAICSLNSNTEHYDFDYSMFRTLDFCKREKYSTYCFASHQPQIISKEFYIEFLKEHPETVIDGVCEWSGYFNYLNSRHGKFVSVKPYVSICWMGQHDCFYEPQKNFLFENFYSEYYKNGGIFEGLAEDEFYTKKDIWKSIQNISVANLKSKK
jgi:glycosyltransferase involved in cell wall biosynthesis